MFRKVAVFLASVSLVLILSACNKVAVNGIPTVSSPVYGTVPEITFPGGKPPQSAVMEVLDPGKNDGKVVGENDLVVVDYYGKVWGGGLMPDSTITDTSGPQAFSLANPPIQGWKNLIGAKTGQRVLLVVPPQQAYGELGSETIGVKKNDTLAYVVDIRNAVSPDTAKQFQGTPTNDPLPTGVTVGDSGGGLLTITATGGSNHPTSRKAFVYARGNGPMVTPGQSVVYKRVEVKWGETSKPEEWLSPELFAIKASLVDLENLPLGSIAVEVFPATATMDPRVALVQIVASYDAGR